MKRIFSCFAMFAFLCLIICPLDVGAADGEALFKSGCGRCHGSSGEAPAFSPVKFAGSQWERFFSRDKHKRWKDTGSIISSEEMNSIKQYLMAHAADSDLPVAAGLR